MIRRILGWKCFSRNCDSVAPWFSRFWAFSCVGTVVVPVVRNPVGSEFAVTVNELIEMLETYRDDFDAGEWEVRMVYQRNYPLESGIHNVCSGDEINAADEDDEDFEADQDVPSEQVLYIAEGTPHGYGSKRAWGC